MTCRCCQALTSQARARRSPDAATLAAQLRFKAIAEEEYRRVLGWASGCTCMRCLLWIDAEADTARAELLVALAHLWGWLFFLVDPALKAPLVHPEVLTVRDHLQLRFLTELGQDWPPQFPRHRSHAG
jgi:hypothetical protein